MNIYYEQYVIEEQAIFICGDSKGVSFIGTPKAELEEVKHYLKEIELIPSQHRYSKVAHFLRGYLTGEEPEINFEISLNSGTDLQRTVWQKLLTIPYGHKISYQELAEISGKPQAIRAVATAVAKNPLLFLVPCHRVVRKDQTIGQYRGGTPLKVQLIELEQAHG